ncbi:MAG: hypothetical protein ABH879_04600, partial [archaeon]
TPTEMARKKLQKKTADRDCKQHAEKRHGRNIAWPHRLATSQTFLREMFHTQHIIEVQLMEPAIEPMILFNKALIIVLI